MVLGHEQPHFTNPSDDQFDRQMERLVDQGVVTPYGAAAQVLDFDPQRDNVVVRDPRAAEAARKRTNHSRRGGRSFPEPSDSALDPYWQQTELTPLSGEDVLTNRVAAGMIQAMLRAQRTDPNAAAEHAAHLDEVRARLDAEASPKSQ